MENQIMGKTERGNSGQQNSVSCLLKMVPSQETLIQLTMTIENSDFHESV